MALFRGGQLKLADGEKLTLLDYQFPLKAVRGDATPVPAFDGWHTKNLDEGGTIV